MAVLDFPASPITGDKYPVTAVPGQPQYTYDGVKWTTIGAQISNAAPATALPLMDAATALVGTATKYAREDHVHPKIAAAPMDALAYSGLQINGSMEVSQEKGTTAITITNTVQYAIDGWALVLGGPAALSLGQYPATGYFQYHQYCIASAVGTAQVTMGSGDFCFIWQKIEGWRIARLMWGTANAQPLTIGFWSNHVRPGVYSVTIRNGVSNRSYSATYNQAASNTAQYNVVTIPGCTDGAWTADNTPGIVLIFAMAAGASLVAPTANTWAAANYVAAPGQVNAVAATTDTFRITGVVVLPGIAAPTAAQSPLIMRPYDQERLTCKRYYEQLDGMIGTGQSFSATQAFINCTFTEKRAAPTISLFNPNIALWRADTQALPITAFSSAPYSPSLKSMSTLWTVAGGLVAGNATTAFSNPDGGMKIDARL